MILTDVLGNVADLNVEGYHVETALVKSEDLAKRIMRVTSDHGRDFGIRLSEQSAPLEGGAAFEVGPLRLLVLSVIPDEVLVITPASIDEMGIVAHFVGNLHKPVQIENGAIRMLYDTVVEKELARRGVAYEVTEASLSEPMRYVDMTEGSAA